MMLVLMMLRNEEKQSFIVITKFTQVSTIKDILVDYGTIKTI